MNKKKANLNSSLWSPSVQKQYQTIKDTKIKKKIKYIR